MKIFINGRLVNEKDATISVFDHGFLYGDGVFEGIRTYNGRVFMLCEHVDRLYDSARAIALDMPMTRKAMVNAVVRTCKANKANNGYVRLIVTRGVGTMGLNPYLCRKPQVIIIASSIQLYPKKLYREGLSVITAGTLRNIPEALNPRIKSLNYLNNILAKIEAVNGGVVEAIMLNAEGFVAEATGDNVFAVKGKNIITPPASEGALEGITRNLIIKLAREMGYTAEEKRMSRYDLYTADEVFLTGTAAEVIPVVNIDRRKIGSGNPGKHTRKLIKAFHEFTEKNGVPISQ